ncbi:ANTAR domain-containing response regulator [Staphylococcus agnetis]|uniref:ANTAR domain-containing response regulator n=1 Tax=Staphylococcus agnetis TaxID=985762 RepID=UPI000D033E99|nr:response regulator [Staphylococcus agnetis]MBY7664323.1 response regulator [Staphylococcus agnetis]NJH68850.1 response regulator [Staphylococcus agnetis]PTH67932.1 ANTAR domain-containing protein [Staphylococcus agnetis]TRW82586.1 response regulator [Staphylococcus agnetis]
MSKNVLVVEDEAIIRLDIIEMIKDLGYKVIGAVSTGEKAIEFVHQNQPDLILMDIKLPQLNGIKASKIISKKFDIPILILTAYSQPEYIEEAKKANIMGYLIKPITESQLLPAMEIIFSQSKKQLQLKHEIQHKDTDLKHRKCIEKAKGLLMEHQHNSEQQAYRKMRKLSMHHQMEMYKVATQIIKKLDH